jgi:DNA mismatch endonuclease (patch repair protein)
MDNKTAAERSRNMSKIRSVDTKPELVIRKRLFADGFRYRLHDKKLPGKPDIVLKKYRAAVFINGCFWHGHEGCKYSRIPETHADFWAEKIGRNKERDTKERQALADAGWRVLVIWTCALRNKAAVESTYDALKEWLTEDSSNFAEIPQAAES